MSKTLPHKIRVAAVRSYPAKGDLAANFNRLMEILAQIAPQRPDVVVTPECWLDGYIVTRGDVTARNLSSWAIDPATAPQARAVSDWARQHRAWVIFGCSRRVRGGVANSALIYNRQGGLAGIYDKVHCRGHDRKFVAGQRLPVFKADFGRFGVMICADRRWPETVRTLALGGAHIIFNPTYGMHDEKNVCVMRARSFESETPIVFAHPRQSLYTDAAGDVLVNDTCAVPPFSVCEVNLSSVRALRADPDSFLNTRRPKAYAW
ncbi:MAG: carbon-nitrogen hydrolase family protein [Opitutaceae bacterium]|nr:carbon-nitrogen hydrolase family protein [Opitutaceae bacterium]